MAIAHFDRRADWYAESKPRAVNRDMDVVAICDHQYRQLERIHMAHWRDDSAVLLDALTKVNEDRIAIRVIACGDAEYVERQPTFDPNQLEVWTRGDEAVVMESGTAA